MDDQFRVFPNPATEMITIQISGNAANAFNVFDVSGKLVKSGTLTQSQIVLNLESFEAGVYVVNLLDGKGNVMNSRKFSVVK